MATHTGSARATARTFAEERAFVAATPGKPRGAGASARKADWNRP